MMSLHNFSYDILNVIELRRALAEAEVPKNTAYDLFVSTTL